MIKIISQETENEKRIVEMKDMKPLQIGQIIDNNGYKGEIVMRTASYGKFEVIRLTDSGEDHCWTFRECGIKVELFPPEKKIILEISNS